MPSQASSSQNKSRNVPRSTLRLDYTPPDGPPAKKQKLKPLTALSRPPVFETGSSSQAFNKALSQKPTRKGKEKASPEVVQLVDSDEEEEPAVDDRLWIDIYEPKTEEELAVHVRKVRDVRQWLVEAFERSPTDKLRKYRRILALTGPAGTAKTATIRVLSRELGFDIIEWRSSVDDAFNRHAEFDPYDEPTEYEGLSEKFHKFLTRAASCRSIFGPQSTSSTPAPPSKRHIILLEDLPNILHAPTQQAFHASLEALVAGSAPAIAPVVLVISDAGVRGETGDDASASVAPWRGGAREAVDFRSVIPPSLWHSPFVTQISFNPIAPTLMKRALQHLLSTHFATPAAKASGARPPSKDTLDLVVESAHGDIRSAVMALQFACTAPAAAKGNAKLKRGGERALLAAVTRREQSLALFHLVGKVLYNKRKGDPPAASMSKGDAQKERDLDAKLKDPPNLPPHLQEQERRASRVDVDMLYADTPIDSSLLSLYIHQNYTQYCNEIDECANVVDWLSYVDSSGGDTWLQANPHRFHLLTLGTMHALPSPVQRRGQKSYKPEFFDVLKREKDADTAAAGVRDWVRQRGGLESGWTKDSVVRELGGVLKALDAKVPSAGARPPPSHRLFSSLQFVWNAPSGAKIADEDDLSALQDVMRPDDDGLPVPEGDDRGVGDVDVQDEVGPDGVLVKPETVMGGGWLEDDDIEDA